MNDADSTCWTMIRAAADGDPAGRSAFAARYDAPIRAYLGARWRATPLVQEIDDAAQAVFVECFRDNGVLANADPDRTAGFRAFLRGAVRNVALRVEEAKARAGRIRSADTDAFQAIDADETHLSLAFDRAWAQRTVHEAAERMNVKAAAAGPPAVERVELLRLRFEEDLPIRAIAERWGRDAALLHRDYAEARKEFKAALMEVIAFHHPGDPSKAREECGFLLSILGQAS